MRSTEKPTVGATSVDCACLGCSDSGRVTVSAWLCCCGSCSSKQSRQQKLLEPTFKRSMTVVFPLLSRPTTNRFTCTSPQGGQHGGMAVRATGCEGRRASCSLGTLRPPSPRASSRLRKTPILSPGCSGQYGLPPELGFPVLRLKRPRTRATRQMKQELAKKFLCNTLPAVSCLSPTARPSRILRDYGRIGTHTIHTRRDLADLAVLS